MAERRNQYVDREEYLRQAAHDADNMLRQLQDFTLDSASRTLGRSRDMGSGNRIRGTSPQVGRGNSKRSSWNKRGRKRQGSIGGDRDSPGYGWPLQSPRDSPGYGCPLQSPRDPPRYGWPQQSPRDPPRHGWPLQRRQFSDYIPGYGRTDHLTVRTLVEALSSKPTYSASLLQIMEGMALSPSSVREVASGFPWVFHVDGETVELRPEVTICTAHPDPQGCSRASCKALHICPKYVFSWCHVKNCVLGHRWHTDHNISVLKLFLLDHLQMKDLRKLVRHVSGQSNPEPLDVCRKYNEGGCSQTDCGALHVCRKFLTRLTSCPGDECRLNHDLLRDDCSCLLKSHGISVNEAPRDIVVALLAAIPSLAQPDEPSSRRKASSRQRLRPQQQQTPKEDAKRKLKWERERRAKEVVNTRRERNLKEGRKRVGSESDSLSESDIDDDGNSLLSKSDSESGERESEDGVVSEKRSARRTSETNRKLKSMKEKYIKNRDNVDSSSSSGGESDSDENDLEISASSDCGEDRSHADVKKEATSKRSKKNVTPGSGDENATAAPPTRQKRVKRRTTWSHYLQGDVPVLEICYYSVESSCKNEASACQRLHASQHFHWQVAKRADQWFNLRPSQVTCLERAFCDPSQDGVDLPRIDPSTLEISLSGLFIVMSRELWRADFKAMNLTDSSGTKVLHLRRLCTETISGQAIKPANFLWYFLDKNQKWVQYGQVDTAGETKLVCNVTSVDIEKHFQQNPSGSVSFQNFRFTYVLDFTTMNQTNQVTKVARAVRRRPEPHLPHEKGDRNNTTYGTDLPIDWETMQAEERIRRVPLSPSSPEYQTVLTLLQQTLPNPNVLKVERIQNPYLWRAFQNKVKEMTAVYGDASQVDIRQLFHGTRHDVVPSICAENFDWRLHGSASGQAFGRGTYFARDASYSYGYCVADVNNMKYLFVASTAVGSMAVGNSAMVRPPPNPATNAPYDSTVNTLTAPSIFVKYDKQEYYPQYIVTLT